jgi:type VII secretion-associated serine protease mycosin
MGPASRGCAARWALRCGAALSVVGLVAGLVAAGVLPAPPASALTPPVVNPDATPPDTPPQPDQPMRMAQTCAVTGILPGSDVGTPPIGQAFMNLPALWQSAGKGAGITVALIDTGVNRSPRFEHLRGAGDYVVADGDGLSDCDSHGTVVASIIGAAPSETDGLVGVAPDADLVSIRQSSDAYQPENPSPMDMQTDRRAGTVSSLARAVVHAANTGAKVINMSVVACVPVLKPVDQTALGAALRYAAIDRDVVLVTAAGNLGSPGCTQNGDIDPTHPADPRNWGGVVTVSTPSWFSDYVLSVSATDGTGAPAADDKGNEISLSGPWVGVGAPGVFVEGANDRGLYNGMFDSQAGEIKSMSGTSFASAYVSGLAALVRGKYPNLSAAQVIQRIEQTAHSPANVVDNRVGYGTIDPVAALNNDVPIGNRLPTEHLTRRLVLPAPAPAPDRRPMATALIGSTVVIMVVVLMFGVLRLAGVDRRPGMGAKGWSRREDGADVE